MNFTRIAAFIKQSLKSKTVWFAALAAGQYLLNQPHVGPQEILHAVEGIGLAAAVKDATVTGGKSG